LPSLRDNEWKDWLEYAEEDRREALDRFSHGKWREACYHAQQAIEKVLKALVIRIGIFMPTHELTELIKIVEEKYKTKILGATVSVEEVRKLALHYYASRYPDATRRLRIKYNEETAKKCIEIMEKVWSVIEKYVKTGKNMGR